MKRGMCPVGIIFHSNIVNRGKWLRKSMVKIKEGNKQGKIYAARSLRLHVLCSVTMFELHIRNASVG